MRHLELVREYEEKRGMRVGCIVALLVCGVASWSGRISWFIGLPAIAALVHGLRNAVTNVPQRPAESYAALQKIPVPGCFGEDGIFAATKADDGPSDAGAGYRARLRAAAGLAMGTVSSVSSVSWRFLHTRVVADPSGKSTDTKANAPPAN